MRVLKETATLRIEVAFELEEVVPVKFNYYDRKVLPLSVVAHWQCDPGEDWKLWRVDVNGPFVKMSGHASTVRTSNNWVSDLSALSQELRELVESTRPDPQTEDHGETPPSAEGQLVYACADGTEFVSVDTFE